MEYVSFPKLGWTIPVHEEIVSFELFGQTFAIRWYAVIIALGLCLAIWYAYRRADEFRISKDAMFDAVLVCALAAIVGARLYYVVFSEDRAAYFANPISILQIWNGGLAIYGAVIFAFVSGFIMCRVKKIDTLRMFDLAAPGFLIGQAVGRWGNFVNQEAFGGNTTLPWGMSGSEIAGAYAGAVSYDPALPVHPTFLYESLWCALGLLVIHIVSKRAYRFRGQLFALYVMWYGTGRFFIEQLRTDSLYFGTMRVSCLVAALSVLGGLALYFVFKERESRLPKTLQDEETVLAENETLTTDVESEEVNDGSTN